MRTRTPHTCCRQGKRVFIKTKDGLEYRGKFYERTANRMIVLYGGQKIPAGVVKIFSMRRLCKIGSSGA